MRLFLLPISTRRTLIYCQRINEQVTKEQSYIDKITTRASTTWVKWEKYEEGWQKKVTEYGNKLFQRLAYEEWGLKSIPPLNARRKAQALEGHENAHVEFPASIIPRESVLGVMRSLSTERQALHKKWMWGSIIGMPMTAPVALLPVLPNIPFFYLVFRAWSHWRALSGSRHIEFLLDHNLIRTSPLPLLNTLYAINRVDLSLGRLKTELDGIGSGSDHDQSLRIPKSTSDEEMLLSPMSGRLFADALEVAELEAEIDRAVQQVKKSIEAKEELKEEKDELDAATKGPRSTR